MFQHREQVKDQKMSDALRIQLSENLQSIRQRMQAACSRVGRSTDEVTLVAVTKYAEVDWVQELVKLGINDLGEARPQQISRRVEEFKDEIRWHLIGHLQRNKAEEVIKRAHLIHSVDSLRLFEHLGKLSKANSKPARILFEVNISGESTKDGFRSEDLIAAWPQIQIIDSLEIAGLMTMAPHSDDVAVARTVFQKLRELRDKMAIESGGRWPLRELSMGMSGDFEIGIEEGATIVRIGSSLFEGVSGLAHEDTKPQ